MRRSAGLQGNLLGGHDRVTVKPNGRAKIVRRMPPGPTQLVLGGGEEWATTKRNQANREREAEDERQGRAAK